MGYHSSSYGSTIKDKPKVPYDEYLEKIDLKRKRRQEKGEPEPAHDRDRHYAKGSRPLYLAWVT